MPDDKDMEGGCFGSSVLGSSVVFVPNFCDIKNFKKISKISWIWKFKKSKIFPIAWSAPALSWALFTPGHLLLILLVLGRKRSQLTENTWCTADRYLGGHNSDRLQEAAVILVLINWFL